MHSLAQLEQEEEHSLRASKWLAATLESHTF